METAYSADAPKWGQYGVAFSILYLLDQLIAAYELEGCKKYSVPYVIHLTKIFKCAYL